MILLLCILLHSVSSLNIRIDGDNGIDSKDCLTKQPQSSCQSLKDVADTINNTGNLTIEIISPTLSLQGSVIFTDINGLTINGQGTRISCRNGSIIYGNSGIVFDTCSNVKLNSFTIEHCGLLYKNGHHGFQSVLFYNCRNFNISKVNFSDNNGSGLVLYDTIHGNVTQNVFSNNGIQHSRTEGSNATGGGLCILQYTPYNKFRSTNSIIIASNQFINNFAPTIGGALYLEVDHCANLLLLIATSNFIGNRAGTAGGALGFIVHKGKCNYNGTISMEFWVALSTCNITNNQAKFGGGVAIQTLHSASGDAKRKEFNFEFCHFSGNKAVVSSAVDISGRRQRVYKCLETVIRFHECFFIGNIAGIDKNEQELRGKLFKATLYATDAFVEFIDDHLFANNTGTALYAVNSRVYFSHHAHIKFSNNTGDQGGAIFLAEESVMTFSKHSSSSINISNNKALIGGAIYIQSLINIHEGTCFISQPGDNVTFHFTNNIATSGYGHGIFASTLQDCVKLYKVNRSTQTLFTDGKMGKFEFSSRTPPPVATAPVKLSINEKELVPYPGIPYNMTITQTDELNSNITNLQLFPLLATLRNVHNSSLKIDVTHSIADSYIIVFKGTVGDTATLLLKTTEFSARKLINITLYRCPPGYTFQINTCHCNSNYYYGISGCLEDDAAIIDGGLWAGYIGEKFTTADCVSSLCDYHNSKGMVYCVVVVSLTIPLTFTLLAFIVVSLHTVSMDHCYT
uniref:Right handed beta helix domain-containing protein n=1 Tax=Amphimedon queenslandica TaxID=400682 RepID=A0A1X7SXY3_AMPQE